MLKDIDNSEGRIVTLAKHLLALKEGVQLLSDDIDSRSISTFPRPGCPRVFSIFADEENRPRLLTYKERLSDHNLCFSASVSSQTAFVKIFFGSYGLEVHRILAKEGMAPKLLGSLTDQHGPTMVVMEMLAKSEWISLDEFSQTPKWQEPAVRLAISQRLWEIQKKLRDTDYVHGDMRPKNIMVKKSDENVVILVGFDCAGRVGEAKYPRRPGDEILGESGLQDPARA
ncbi:hypothetical protein CPB86DRAFT_356865 [Serendipita vermifera]|nr:hypothetical protein CPB86DRAFT_356865 [Serendipita vermifera]